MPLHCEFMAAPSRPPFVPTLSRDELRSRAFAFSKHWAGPQREKAEAQTFLNQFFDLFGRDRRAIDARFEHPVEREGRGDGSVDLFWPGKLVVEMKSTGKDLSNENDGAARQAFDYLDHLEPEDRPRWVLVSDFAHFVLYDLGEEVHDYLKGLASARKTKPAVVAQFPLAELADKLRHFAFIRDEEQALFQTQPGVNLQAVALLARFHDALHDCGYAGHDLERLLVRVLFCLFAEDTDIFPWNSFTRVVERSRKDGTDLGQRLAKLFDTLNGPVATRQTALPVEFAQFPYVNGGLFAERLGIADFTTANRAALLACCRFDWSRISPSIFGSLFQGVMEPAARRKLGAHYTSEENIRRVIDPLFLDALKAEFQKLRTGAGKNKVLEQFHQRLSALRFLDPACGCGNFLVVAYRELRALELAVLREIYGGQLALDLDIGDIVRVNVDQFYGIEIEEFPALIAETALWLTDHQINVAVSKAFGRHYARIPLVKAPTIVHGNALRLDWHLLLSAARCSYVFGNPPFIGKKEQNAAQKADMESIWCGEKGTGILDYVTCWYRKTVSYIQGTDIRCAFVSTNSITQGEQVGVLWAQLSTLHVKIHFAHRTFVWRNEASGNAHVHVVIIGFGAREVPVKRLFDYDRAGHQSTASGTASISPYLVVGSDRVVRNRTTPINGAPPISYGSMMIDKDREAGDEAGLILSTRVRAELLAETPALKPYVRRLYGGEEFLNGTERWCLWLVSADSALIRSSPLLLARLESVRHFRLKSSRPQTRELAATPGLFGEIRQPDSRYLLFPKVSSENRSYLPIGFMSPKDIASGSALVVPGATSFHFGVLSSAMHNAWMRCVAGRMKSDFQYSGNIVYNNFPWPEPDARQRAAIETAAQAVLDARAPHLVRGASLADLYDPLAMPAELLKAHQFLDRAVDKGYRPAVFTSERERVEFLFALYEKIVSPLAPAAPTLKRAKRSTPAKSVPPPPADYTTQAELNASHTYFGAKEGAPAAE